MSRATETQGMSMQNFGMQGATDRNDLSSFLAQSSMPYGQAAYNTVDPRRPADVKLDQGVQNIASLFEDPQLLGVQVRQRVAQMPGWLQEMMPVQPPTGSIADEEIISYISNERTLEPTDDYSLAPVVTYNEHSRKFTLTQGRLGFNVGNKELMAGSANNIDQKIAMKIRTVVNAAKFTLIKIGHIYIQEAPLVTHQIPIQSNRNYAALWQNEIDRFGSISLRKHGLFSLLSSVFTDRQRITGCTEPTIIVVGPGTKTLPIHSSELFENYRVGPQAQEIVKGNVDPYFTYKGARIYEEGCYDVQSLDGRLDPMASRVSIGYHFTVPSNQCCNVNAPNYSAECNNSLAIHDAGLDSIEVVGFEDLIANNPYYEMDGSLNRNALTKVLDNYRAMERKFGVTVAQYKNRPMIDPHVATVGELQITPYIISTIGESMGCYFSERKLATMVSGAVKRVKEVGGIDFEAISWLRNQMLNAYNADPTANLAELYAAGYNANIVSISAETGLPETNSEGISGDLADATLDALTPVTAPLPAGCSNLSWAYFLSRNNARAQVSAEDRQMLAKGVRETMRFMRMLRSMFDLPSAKGADNRNPLFTTAALPINQIPIVAAQAAKMPDEELELIAAAQNTLFFVGQPLTIAAPRAGAQPVPGSVQAVFPDIVRLDQVANTFNGEAANVTDVQWRALAGAVLSVHDIDASVKKLFLTLTKVQMQEKVVKDFNDRMERTRARIDVGQATTSQYFAEFVAKYILPAAQDRTNAAAMEASARIFAAFIEEIVAKGSRYFTPTDWQRVQDNARAAATSAAATGRTGGNVAGISPVGTGAAQHYITSLSVDPSFVRANNNLQVVDPRAFSAQLGNREIAKGIDSTSHAVGGGGNIFAFPHLSAAGVMSGSASSASSGMHGGAGFQDPSTGRHALTDDSIKSASSALFATSVLHRAIMNPDFAARISRAAGKVSDIERAVEMAILNVPINAQVFINMKNNNIEPPVTQMVFYPNVTFKMNCAYAAQPNVGKLRLEFAHVNASKAPNGMMHFDFNVHYGGGLIRPEEVSIMHNTMFREYIGGMSVRNLTHHGPIQSHGYGASDSTRWGDGFVITTGVDYKPPSPIVDVTGFFNPSGHSILPPEIGNIKQFYSSPTYPSAMFHSLFTEARFPLTGSLSSEKMNFHQYSRSPARRYNTICHTGRQWIPDGSGGFQIVEEGWGYGAHIQPGRMRAVYNGQAVLNTESVVRVI